MLGKKKKQQIQEKHTFFNDTWKEVELIGEGSYGKVYKAKKEEFGISTYSAIKQIEIPQTKAEIQTLKTEGMTQGDITSYFEKSVQKWVEEVKFMSIFKDSENIVTIEDYEIIKKKNEIGWIINIKMELLKNIDAYVLEKNITDKEMLKMAIDVATALEDCEAKDVIHRDIKPDNIFVNGKGVYKVGDFGIAKHIESTVSNMSKKGTENYMAPELYKNEKGNKTVDIYSLGIMLYRYFNYNRLPFLPDYPEKITVDAREEALYKRISGEKLKSPKNAPREIAEIILKACSYYPKDRYANATELKEALQEEYNKIKKPRILFDFNEKQMNKIFLENTKSDSHSGTLSVFEDTQSKDPLDMTVGIGFENPKETEQILQAIEEQNKKESVTEEIENIIEPVEQEKALETGEQSEENLKTEETVEKTGEDTKNEEVIEKEPAVEQKENAKQDKKKNKKEKKEKKIKQNKEEQENRKKKAKSNKENVKKEEKIKNPIWIKLKKHRIKIIVFIAIIILALGIVGISQLNKSEEVAQIEYVKMVQLVGLTSEEATQKINELGLEVQYEYVEVDDETQVGKVLEQSIEENQEVSKGSSITIKVAVSKEKVTMINVVGMNIEEATQKLAELGLQVNVTEQNSDDVEQGIIISQMTPEGEEVNIGITVELLVSLGIEPQEQDDNNNNKQDNSSEVNHQNKEWSAWVETLPNGVNSSNYQIEQKMQYSYRTKQTTTSENSVLDGWTKYDEQHEYGKSYTQILYSPAESTGEKEYTLVQTKHKYSYEHRDSLYNGVWYVSGSYSMFPEGANNGQQTSTTKDVKSTTLARANTITTEPLYAIGTKCQNCGYDAWAYTGETTMYQYTVREITKSTYYYYKWSDWSAYSDAVATSNDSTEVRTKTLYRYRAK